PAELTEYVFNYYDWDVRPRHDDGMASTGTPADPARPRVALLSHADTDLLALKRAQSTLPPELETFGISLLRLQTEEQLSLLFDSGLAGARVVILRLHGELAGVPGLVRLQAWAHEHEVALAIVSGTGEPRADFATASSVELDVLEAIRTYLTIGGERNVAECLKFVADRVLLTGFGSAPPLEMPEHGVYLRDLENATIEDWERGHDAERPIAAVLFYRAHVLSGNTAFVDELVDALEAAGVNALAVY